MSPFMSSSEWNTPDFQSEAFSMVKCAHVPISSYRAHHLLGKWWPVKHSRDLHRKFEFQRTSEIEGVFGNYRTFVRRMYHHHRSINLEKYVREFCFRFSSPELFKNPKFYLTKSLTLGTTCY